MSSQTWLTGLHLHRRHSRGQGRVLLLLLGWAEVREEEGKLILTLNNINFSTSSITYFAVQDYDYGPKFLPGCNL